MRPRILIVEDSLPLAAVWTRFLADQGMSLHFASTGGAAREALELDGPPAAILLDLGLPDMDGFDILRHVQAARLESAVVVVTGNDSVDSAVAAMRLGAADYLTKPVSGERLRSALRDILGDRRRRSREVLDIGAGCRHGFIGESPPMRAVYRAVERAAQSRANVLIAGESGTGKEICATAIHALGPRAAGPFVAVNCGAIPAELVESEIFGHRRGAFTGALADRPGAARLADGGTLFLDEICELPLALQASLLRFVETGVVQPVGSGRAEKVDVRILAATNRNPAEEVAAGRFRADLYYRLQVLGIEMPPLAGRGEDVLLIARAALARYAAEEGRHFVGFTAAAEAALAGYAWPGNVRELQNLIRAIVVFHDGAQIDYGMLPQCVRDAAQRHETDGSDRRRAGGLAAVERRTIEAAISHCGGDVRGAARLLGISASTIYRKRSRWGGMESE